MHAEKWDRLQPVIPLLVPFTRIGRRRQKSPSRCIFSADDLRSCRPQKVENADARRASADRLPTGCRKVGQASACHPPARYKMCVTAGKRRKKIRVPEITGSQGFQEALAALGATALSTAASATRPAIANCTANSPFAASPVSLQPSRPRACWMCLRRRLRCCTSIAGRSRYFPILHAPPELQTSAQPRRARHRDPDNSASRAIHNHPRASWSTPQVGRRPHFRGFNPQESRSGRVLPPATKAACQHRRGHDRS